MTEAVLQAFRDHWGWAGLDPVSIDAVSAFGHMIIQDCEGSFWHFDPETREVARLGIKADVQDFFATPEVREFWEASLWVEQASALLGSPPEGHCYSFKPLALLKADYASENFWHAPLHELVSFTGDVARQTAGLPDGATYQLKVMD